MAKENGTVEIKAKGLRELFQQLAMLIGVAAASTGGYRAFVQPAEIAAAVAIDESRPFVELLGQVQSHCQQQEQTEAKQERTDTSQDNATQMLNQGISDGFRSMEGRLAGMEAKLEILLRRQGGRP